MRCARPYLFLKNSRIQTVGFNGWIQGYDSNIFRAARLWTSVPSLQHYILPQKTDFWNPDFWIRLLTTQSVVYRLVTDNPVLPFGEICQPPAHSYPSGESPCLGRIQFRGELAGRSAQSPSKAKREKHPTYRQKKMNCRCSFVFLSSECCDHNAIHDRKTWTRFRSMHIIHFQTVFLRFSRQIRVVGFEEAGQRLQAVK